MALPVSQRPLEQPQPALIPSPQTQIRQLMDAHESSSIMRDGALPDHGGQIRSSTKTRQPPFQDQLAHGTHLGNVNGVVQHSGIAGVSSLHTPVGSTKGVVPTTPLSIDANRNTLAQDIIRALRPPSTKRKRIDGQDEERRDSDISLNSPLAKKGRVDPASDASRTEAMNAVTNQFEDVRHSRGSGPASLVQHPSTPGFDARSVTVHQFLQSTSQGHLSSHYGQAMPQWPQWPSFGHSYVPPQGPPMPQSLVPPQQHAVPQTHVLPQRPPMSQHPGVPLASPMAQYGVPLQRPPTFQYGTPSQGPPASQLGVPSQGPPMSYSTVFPSRPHMSEYPEPPSSHVMSQYSVPQRLPMPQPHIPPQRSTHLAGQQPTTLAGPSQQCSGSPSIRPSTTIASNQQRPPETVSSMPLPRKPIAKAVSIPSIDASTSLQASQQSRTNTLSDPVSRNTTVSKPPLFLPSESPPSSTSEIGISSLSWKPSGLTPVVELGPSLSKLKSQAHLVKGDSFPKAEVSSASILHDSALVDLTDEPEPIFGRPTGVLAVASELVAKPSQSGLQEGHRRPRSKAYVLIPKIDTKAWLISGWSVERDNVNHVQRKEQTFERRRNIVDDPHVQDFPSRLIQRSCLWKTCHAILDSTEKLLKHVKIVHGLQEEDQLYRCHWKGCHNIGCFPDSERLIRHLQGHVTARVYCAYKNCDFQTQLPNKLVEHTYDDHNDDDPLQPIAVPKSAVAPELPALVGTLPSYLSIPLRVTGQSIMKDQHQKSGPSVLQRISSKVDNKRGGVSVAVPLRSQRLGKQALPRPDEMPQEAARFELQDEYGFMRKESPVRSFRPLIQLPHIIDDVEVVDGYPVDDAAVPVMSEPVNAPSIMSGPMISDQVVDNLAGTEDGTVGHGTVEHNTQNVVRAVHEDIDSREVEELL